MDSLPPFLRKGIRLRNGGKKRTGIGMERMGKELIRGSQFNPVSEIPNGNLVAEVFDDGEVVGNKKNGKVSLFLQFVKKVDHLGTDRDVKGRDRFIADKKLRIPD